MFSNHYPPQLSYIPSRRKTHVTQIYIYSIEKTAQSLKLECCPTEKARNRNDELFCGGNPRRFEATIIVISRIQTMTTCLRDYAAFLKRALVQVFYTAASVASWLLGFLQNSAWTKFWLHSDLHSWFAQEQHLPGSSFFFFVHSYCFIIRYPSLNTITWIRNCQSLHFLMNKIISYKENHACIPVMYIPILNALGHAH